MTTPHNVELEAANHLQKLIQESKDEPAKLAVKLYVILEHMKATGKENSMPYQVISKGMETVTSQHGIDIEVLKSAPLLLPGGTQAGDSSSSSPQFAGSSHASNSPPVGPSGAGHHQPSSKSFDDDHGSPSSFDTRSTDSDSEEEMPDTPNWEKAN